MATKDAAFRAYVHLYEAGLINNNLLPTPLPDPIVAEIGATTEKQESLIWVRGRINPWTCFWDSRERACQQILTISAQASEIEQFPCLHLLFPDVLDISMAFNLFWTNEKSINVQVRPERLVGDIPHDQEFLSLSRQSTQRLLESIFLGKMPLESENPQTSPFLLSPFLETTLLQNWLTACTGDTSAETLDILRPDERLIRLKRGPKEARPYVFRSLKVKSRESQWIQDSTVLSQPAVEEVHFEVKVLPKRLDYLHPPNYEHFNRAIECVPAAECYVDHFPASYAKFMLLLPSILHRLEIRIVAMALNRNILSSIGFQHFELVEKAICSSAANESSNYQRLELVGDSVLKFWTSAQLCAQFPGWHEGYLSRGKDRVVSNSHLCQAARDHGLDEYIHTTPFTGSRWRPPFVDVKAGAEAIVPGRNMSSKVLADVVEALLGASFLDGIDVQETINKVRACLKTFLARVPWRSPTENASILKNLVPTGSPGYQNFDLLTEITGYSFDKKILLVEALTHPSHPPVGIQGTYQRLEFLGDSILDFLVVETMARHIHEIPHFTMHLIRAAVVNAHLLAFFCLGAGLEQDRGEVIADGTSGAVEIRTANKKTYLWQFMKHSSKLELLKAQEACAKRYYELHHATNEALDHGRSHPWCLLLDLNAEKFFSDMIESILGAIFIDSNGDLEACREFLSRLGLLRYLGRIMSENVDIMHPKERLGIVAGNSKVRYVSASKVVDGVVQYCCSVFVNDEAKATSLGEVSQAAAEARAAQDAVRLLSKKKGKSMEEGEEEVKA